MHKAKSETINWVNVPIGEFVIPRYEAISGKRLMVDGSVAGSSITINSQIDMEPAEAIEFIKGSLLLNGFAIIEKDEKTDVLINAAGKSPVGIKLDPRIYLDAEDLPEGDRIMADVFQSWGMELSEAQEVVHCLLDWVDADEITTAAPEGAELEWYEKEGLGGGNYPFNRAFYDVDEMQFVKGMDLVAGYKPNWRDYFTVKSQGPVDVNDAPANVIAVAAGLLEMEDIGGTDYSEKVLEIQETWEMEHLSLEP